MYRMGQSTFTVLSMQVSFCIIIITNHYYYSIIFHTNHYKPTLAPPCIYTCIFIFL